MKFSFPGLTDQEAQESRLQHGSNAVTPQEVETFRDKLINNLKDPIIIILIVALVITGVLAIFGYTHWYEGVGIAIAVVLATLVATWSEYSNETAFQKLLEEASMILVKVFRNNRLTEISINDLVVGDYLLLQPGDTVPADGILAVGHLEVSQAALTGESEPLKKRAPETEDAPQAGEVHTLFRASLVEDGEAVMKVTVVGDKTRYGETLKEIISAEDRLSPLQQKLTVLGSQISTFGYIGAAFIAIAFMLNQVYFAPDATGSIVTYWVQNELGVIISDVVTALILAIIIIVVAVPEGLSMMIAIVLSLNMRKLLDAKVLVRKLLGIETAGSLTVLFTDKTGTLTQGQLTVADFLAGDHQHYATLDDVPQALGELITFSLRNNTSAVIDGSNPDAPGIVGADSTEQALLRFLGRRLVEEDAADIVDIIPFNSTRKFSGAQVKGTYQLTLIKGAPEIVLQNCTHYLDAQGERIALSGKDMLNTEMHTLSKRAMRLIAIAISDSDITAEQTLPESLVLVGIFGLRDDLRAESYGAVKRAKKAGIHVIMITGDAKETAEAIARDVGLLEDDPQATVMTSTELGQLTDAQVKDILPHLYVVARAFPTDKSRLIKLAKDIGWVVGMTGDGVNDAPAVRNADVGFAMGGGTEMTKESSDIVILDDNFQSLTQSVLYGRTLFKSIRKFLVFQLTVNVSAILLAFLGPFMGYELPLTMIQLLWINIIMDTLAALAFSGEAALNRYMLEKPIPKDDHLITGEMWSSILTNGVAATMLSLIFLTSDSIQGLFERPGLTPEENNLVFLTAFFSFFVFIHNFNKFNARTESLNLFDHLIDNKNFLGVVALIFTLQIIFTYLGGDFLRTVGLNVMEWVYVILLSALIIPIDLLRKALRNNFFGNPVLTETSS
ncbi:MAG: calcium-translocating P-type ATPase, PMCA-type [Candidatus Contendobacter odensis]|uniref:P-type Ca(2+) transporter n=1 Tax=Candidatus Contendibacter odensensis TaxID=1400860 RepID=A0A2G6PFH2_9GAMM|nr:MAG: calcium-translocating P-type ATPase, PMCA-type [Candidatus Contendobacter odensis]